MSKLEVRVLNVPKKRSRLPELGIADVSARHAFDEISVVVDREVWIRGRTACLAALLSRLVDYANRWEMNDAVAGALRRNAVLLEYARQMREQNRH